MFDKSIFDRVKELKLDKIMKKIFFNSEINTKLPVFEMVGESEIYIRDIFKAKDTYSFISPTYRAKSHDYSDYEKRRLNLLKNDRKKNFKFELQVFKAYSKLNFLECIFSEKNDFIIPYFIIAHNPNYITKKFIYECFNFIENTMTEKIQKYKDNFVTFQYDLIRHILSWNMFCPEKVFDYTSLSYNLDSDKIIKKSYLKNKSKLPNYSKQILCLKDDNRASLSYRYQKKLLESPVDKCLLFCTHKNLFHCLKCSSEKREYVTRFILYKNFFIPFEIFNPIFYSYVYIHNNIKETIKRYSKIESHIYKLLDTLVEIEINYEFFIKLIREPNLFLLGVEI